MTEIYVSSESYEKLDSRLSIIQQDIMGLPASSMDDVLESRLFKILRQLQSIRDTLITKHD